MPNQPTIHLFDRLERNMTKRSHECIRLAAECLRDGDDDGARRYLDMSNAAILSVGLDPFTLEIQGC